MEVKSIQPAFTGRKLTPQEVEKLIQKNWTLPLGVDVAEFSTKNNKLGFLSKIAEFFKGLFK